MKSEIISELSEYIASQILNQADKKIQQDEKLISSGLIDSFHLVDISIYIEEKFGVLIDDTELNSSTFNTLEELADLIMSRK